MLCGWPKTIVKIEEICFTHGQLMLAKKSSEIQFCFITTKKLVMSLGNHSHSISMCQMFNKSSVAKSSYFGVDYIPSGFKGLS